MQKEDAYYISNLLAFIILSVILIYLLWSVLSISWVFKIPLSVIVVFLCAVFIERVGCKYIGILVEKVINKNSEK